MEIPADLITVPGMRRSASLLIALGTAISVLGGCETAAPEDYFRFEIGHHWEYYLLQGGVDDEHWYLDVKDADENPETARGDFYFYFFQTVPAAVPEQPDIEHPLRRFNYSAETTVDGDGATVVTAWTYRWAPEDEGDRDENFVVPPGAAADWSLDWDYGADTGSTETTFEMTEQRREDPIQTPYATYTDCLELVRAVTRVSQVGNDELTTVQTREETWCNGIGLVRYKITAVDGAVSEALLRDTNVTELTEGE